MYGRQIRQQWNVPVQQRHSVILCVRETEQERKEQNRTEQNRTEQKRKEKKRKEKKRKVYAFQRSDRSLLRRQARVFWVTVCTSQAGVRVRVRARLRVAGVKFLPNHHHIVKYFCCPSFWDEVCRLILQLK